VKKILGLAVITLFCGCSVIMPPKNENEEASDITQTEKIQEQTAESAKSAAKTVQEESQKAEPGTELITKPTHQTIAEPTKKAPVAAVNPCVLIKTSMGNIKVELFADKAPITVKNFLSYVKSGFYKNTLFHRVINNFMIQGGGLDTAYRPKPTAKPIKNEAFNGLSNKRGTIAMARTRYVDSATSQFFINLKDNKFLDHKGQAAHLFGYCVFGKVIDGMDVVDKIAYVKTVTRGRGLADSPLQNVVIKDIVVLPPATCGDRKPE
jgi:peptidyl-prolyl cis-trans isomerase B (cyclophilin B)